MAEIEIVWNKKTKGANSMTLHPWFDACGRNCDLYGHPMSHWGCNAGWATEDGNPTDKCPGPGRYLLVRVETDEGGE